MDEVKLLERVFLNVDSVRTSLYDLDGIKAA